MKRLITVLLSAFILSSLLVEGIQGQDPKEKNYDYKGEPLQKKDDDPWKLKVKKDIPQQKQIAIQTTPWVLSPSITNPPKPSPIIAVQYYWKGDGRCCVPSRNYILTGKLVVLNPK